MFHHDLADAGAGDLPVAFAEDLCLDGVDGLIYLVHGDRPFITGAQDAVFDLGPVVLFPAHIFLDHDQGDRLHFFVGGETFAAGVAEPPAPDGIVFLHRSGIHDTGIFLITKRTSHILPPISYSFGTRAHIVTYEKIFLKGYFPCGYVS